MESKPVSSQTGWHTTAFAQRQKELRSPELRTLYPSQAWSMYRIIPACRTLLDLGFGSIDSLLVVRTINSQIEYLGLDFVREIVESAKHLEDARTKFVQADFPQWQCDTSFDVVQGWSFVYVFDRPYEVMRKMYGLARRHCLFDIRATHLDDDVIDTTRAWGLHDGVKVNYPLLSWQRFQAFVASLRPIPESVEVACYYYPPGSAVRLDPVLPQPFVASIVINKGDEGATSQTRWHGKLIPPLE